MVVDPYAVRMARPTAIPTIRATVTIDDAWPYAAAPAASIAALERGVTVSPKPSPKVASAAATVPMGVAAVQVAIHRSPPTARAMPTSDTSRGPRPRTSQPETSAPTAVAPANAPSASRCWSGPP